MYASHLHDAAGNRNERIGDNDIGKHLHRYVGLLVVLHQRVDGTLTDIAVIGKSHGDVILVIVDGVTFAHPFVALYSLS